MSASVGQGSQGRANPFSLVVVAALLVVGITAFCAFVALNAYAPDLRGDPAGGENVLSKSAVGFAALRDLLQGQGIPVVVTRTLDAADRPAFLILTPAAGGKPVTRRLLLGSAATTLVVLPKWRVVPNADRQGWVDRAGLLNADTVAAILPDTVEIFRRQGAADAVLEGGGGRMPTVEALRAGPIETLQTIGLSNDWTSVLLDESGQPVLARWTGAMASSVYVLSDPDLLDTHGLKNIATARAAMTILDGLRGGAPVTFDVTLNGFGRSPDLLRLLFEPPLLGATLCAAAGAVLMMLMALHRFGPPAATGRALDFGKRALADNAAGLIALAGRESGMAVPYAELTRARVIREIGAPGRLDRTRLDTFLDEAGRARGLPNTYTDLAAAAASARDRASLTAAARRLHQWSQDIRRGHS